MLYCNTTEALEEFCKSICNEKYITIDTEFIRDKTYYPILCLIQIAAADNVAIIDPLNKNIDLLSLDLILQNENIIKIFHCAKQDLEILNLHFGRLPKNIFDTQIAASFIGMGDYISYEAMIGEILDVKIDKTHCLSDWTIRPLDEKQLAYAKADVTYLYQIYPKILNKLENSERLDWFLQEMEIFANDKQFYIDPDKAWKKIKNTHGIKINLVLKRLAAWREKKAQEKNLPRNHFLHERYLLELATSMPITINELYNIKYFSDISMALGEEIVEIVRIALDDQIKEDLLEINEQSFNVSKFKKLKTLLYIQAEKHSIPPRLIATMQDLKDLSSKEIDENNKIFKGWRYEIFGKMIK